MPGCPRPVDCYTAISVSLNKASKERLFSIYRDVAERYNQEIDDFGDSGYSIYFEPHRIYLFFGGTATPGEAVYKIALYPSNKQDALSVHIDLCLFIIEALKEYKVPYEIRHWEKER